MARASARAKRATGEVREFNELREKEHPSFSERLHLLIFNLVNLLGFWGILLCASVPNPLFDLAGWTCGYFGVSWFKFFLATFVGKALIKAPLQSVAVIILFSERTQGLLLGIISQPFPELGSYLSVHLAEMKASFLASTSTHLDPEKHATHLLALAWHIILGVMMGYFVLSTIQSIARSHAQGLLERRIEELMDRSKTDL